MDKETRNAIQRSTQRARELLEREIAEQLEGAYDIRLDGTIASEPGPHLDDREKLVREKLVAAVEHFASFGRTRSESVADYLREAAFTLLNRFVALKMLEARKLVQECVSDGDQSAGFKEFGGLAPGLSQLSDQGYRLYLESIFDEIGQEVGILFDRRDPSSLVWPRRPALIALLEILNAPALADVWGDDETIGWVYQYFNSADERKQMRDESAAPRNSRELAVRNQFFTPRYVVQFLVDNTLARMWWQMREGDTRLADQCEYLVLDNAGELERARKDPRDLKILDPACGSGHFLLYAFDLLLTIYEEAWADGESPNSEATGRALREDYASLDDLRRELPALILARNLYGVDIDARASQIAALALWLRAQRAYRDFDGPEDSREPIRRSHIVVAEPMPGDPALVEEFAEGLQPPLLRDLFKAMVSEMNLAGELGTLLRGDGAIASSITRAREEYVRQAGETAHLPGLEPEQRQEELDFSDIDDVQFFEEVETLLINALRRFAETASGGTGTRRWLFADDAAQGIALIDLACRRYDVVLMNPPFGAATPRAGGYLDAEYPRSRSDLFASFVERGVELTVHRGCVGAITTRTALFLESHAAWRREVIGGQNSLEVLADLGFGVLDAMVEVAAYTVVRDRAPGVFVAVRGTRFQNKGIELRDAIHNGERSNGVVADQALLASLPHGSLAYWIPNEIAKLFRDEPSFSDTLGYARKGVSTSDNFRFLRLAWEVDPKQIVHSKAETLIGFCWVPFAKGGEYSPFYDDVHLVVNWRFDGYQIRNFTDLNGHLLSVPRNTELYFREGLTYPYRTTSAFNPRMLPAGCVFSDGGQGIFHRAEDEDGKATLVILGYLYTRLARACLEVSLGEGDAVVSGSAARNYVTAAIEALPAPRVLDADAREVARLVSECVADAVEGFRVDETSRTFVAPAVRERPTIIASGVGHDGRGLMV